MALVPICHRWSRVRNEVTTIQPWSVLLLHYIYTKFLKIDHLVRKLRGASTHNDLGVCRPHQSPDYELWLGVSWCGEPPSTATRQILRAHSHCRPSRAEPNRTEPNRFGLENKPTLWNGNIHTARRTEPNRTGPSLTERVHWLMFVFTRQPTTDSVAP